MEGDDGQAVEVSGVRASVLGGGTACGLKQRWKDGTTHVVMPKEVLMERLCALVPKSRKHLVTYHGVLARLAGADLAPLAPRCSVRQ